MGRLEDIILRGDRRGMTRLRPLLPDDFCGRAAEALLQALGHPARGTVVVVTGFLVGGRPETDGPPGALDLCRALAALGARPVLVSDGPNAEVLAARLGVPLIPAASVVPSGAGGGSPGERIPSGPGGDLGGARIPSGAGGGSTGPGILSEPGGGSPGAGADAPRISGVITFPVAGIAESESLARGVLRALEPVALVSIERCGPGADGVHRNARGRDISEVTARLETLFDSRLLAELPRRPLTIGVGDGGNEIGMGSLAAASLEREVTPWPSVWAVDAPVIASVSNWGAWGLVAALERATSRTLLPREEEFADDLRELVALQCVDGFASVPQPTVDGFALDENLEILRSLRELANPPGDPGPPGA